MMVERGTQLADAPPRGLFQMAAEGAAVYVGDVVIKVCSASRARLSIGRGYQRCQAGGPGFMLSAARGRVG